VYKIEKCKMIIILAMRESFEYLFYKTLHCYNKSVKALRM